MSDLSWKRVAAFTAALIGAAVLTFTAVSVGYAVFSQALGVGSNTVTFDSLNAPTGVGATGGTSVSLTWTATSDTYASGHRVLRGTAAGGPYAQIAEITPRTTTTYVDSPGNGTFYYVARAFFQNWESANSNEASATVVINTGYLSCTANAAVTASSGDNNGFQLNPGNACADDAAFAEDTNSGTNTTANCTNTGKDRHIYRDYGLSIPAGSTINGVEVRLDAWADSTVGSPYLCVELSWDGGTTWTATQQTTTLTTAQATYTLGSATDTWGRTWAVGDFTNANFRVRITSVTGNNNRDPRLDWVPVRVTYNPL